MLSIETKTEIVTLNIGHIGRVISGSKRAPKNHRVFWNGNMYDSTGSKLWYGDIDLTADEKKLCSIATQLNETIYVTREQPFRWGEQTTESLEAQCELGGNLVVKYLPGQ